MLRYFAILVQGAIELSLGTARSSHAAVLQEMEKGKIFWEDSDEVEKCKNSHTQRMLTSVKPSHSTVNQACIFYNKENVNKTMTIQIKVFFINIAVHIVSRRRPNVMTTQ